MSRANTIQTNFTAGELSPNMYGRVDVAKYFNGARRLRNMLPLPQGGVRRIPGTEYLGAVHDKTKTVVVRRFTFSNNDSYVLEFGDETLRIWQTGALLGAPLVVTSPYDHTDVAQLRFAQSADVLFIAHPDYYPRTLTRVSAASWVFAEYDNEDGPYLSTPVDLTLTLSDVLDRATATAASSIFSTSGSAKNITAVAAISSTDFRIKITATAHGFSTGDTVLIKSVVGVPECLGAWKITNIDANNFHLDTSRKAANSVYVSGGTAQVCSGATVEYREDNVYKLARVIDITSGTVATVDVIDAVVRPDSTVKITKDSTFSGVVAASNSGVFSYQDVGKFIRPTHEAYPPYLPIAWGYIYTYDDSDTVYSYNESILNLNDITKEVIVTSRLITGMVTSSAAYFASTDVGRFLRLKYGARWVVGTITAYTSSTVVTVTFEQEPPIDSGAAYSLYNNGRTDTWKIGAWGSVPGYPAVVGFHQNRLCWASTTTEPTVKWLSKSGDYYNFEPSNPDDSAVSDDSAMTIALISRQVNRVRWLDSGPTLLVGTEGAEWQVKPSSIQQTLTPTNVSATIQTAFGSLDLDCQRIGSQTMFAERNGKKVRELSYDFSIDAFASKDISILSEHILRENGGLVDWTVQTNPYTIIWLALGNGKVATITYEREQEVIAWALHDFGGTVTSCCAIPSATGEDEIYFVIARTVNSVAVKYIERITRIMGGLGSASQPTCYLNSHLSVNLSNVGIDTWGGMDHLIGESVDVLLDGVYLDRQTVQALGVVHVGYLGSVVQAGLPMTSIVGILDPEGGSQAGSSQGKRKRISESVARVEDSYYFKIASATIETNDTENLSAHQDPVSGNYTKIVPDLTLNTRTAQGVAGTVVPSSTWALVSGDISFNVDDAYDNGARFEIVQDTPYPLNLNCLMHKLNTNE